MVNTLTKGTRVKVYQDPITKQRLEGVARLTVPARQHQDYLEWWTVNFDGDSISELFQRLVDPADIVLAEV